MAQQAPFDFQYFISEKNGFVVASLVGLLEGTSAERFDELTQDVLKANFSRLVINLRDVSAFSSDLIPHFAKLQKHAREKNAEIRICGLKPDIKERLNRAGILRPHEITENLQTALQSMVGNFKRAV